MTENDPSCGDTPEVLGTLVGNVAEGDSVADPAEDDKDPDNDWAHRKDDSAAKDGSGDENSTPDSVDAYPDDDDSGNQERPRTAAPVGPPPGYYYPTEADYENWEVNGFPDQRPQSQRQLPWRKRADEDRRGRLHPGS